MTNCVTFYSLAPGLDKFEFSTRLISQLWRQEQKKKDGSGMPLWVLCDSQAVLKQMDDLLWALRQDSFIPHTVVQHYAEFDAQQKCVTISLAMPLPQWCGIMLNLSPYPICQFQNNNVIEVIGHLDQEKIIGRERYKHYQEMSFDIRHHRVEH